MWIHIKEKSDPDPHLSEIRIRFSIKVMQIATLDAGAGIQMQSRHCCIITIISREVVERGGGFPAPHPPPPKNRTLLIFLPRTYPVTEKLTVVRGGGGVSGKWEEAGKRDFFSARQLKCI
jgi:hypothetical protein